MESPQKVQPVPEQHFVVYGGQYGSEGKASAAEFLTRRAVNAGESVILVGENSPNSGHTSSRGKTRNIPAASFWADAVLLGPDSVVDPEALLADWEAVGRKPLFIHEHAALLTPEMKALEHDLVKRISSTGSGSGAARSRKFILRMSDATVKGANFPHGIQVVPCEEWMSIVSQLYTRTVVMECSQGALLDTNFGLFPHCTSRTTLPRAAVERNGLGGLPWTFCGVYRTYPIRTGGPSGPTGGAELSWPQVGREPEIASVTKRVRRVFEFSPEDFLKSLALTRPDILMFTFLDYLEGTFEEWLDFYCIQEIKRYQVFVSSETGQFEPFTTNP